MPRHNAGEAAGDDGSAAEDTAEDKAMSFHIGQQVVCINDRFSPEPRWRQAVSAFPKLHMIYTIRDMREVHGLLGLCFFEIVCRHARFAEGYVEAAFNSKNFRPVKRTSIDVFETLLAPVPGRPLELV
jgi:hypothetical protein